MLPRMISFYELADNRRRREIREEHLRNGVVVPPAFF